ncbi:hypothetical protein IH979_00540, partial [Patescibacteria group bacterium]|nr:hypothetical protein [Patescibacteria group bacterium]
MMVVRVQVCLFAKDISQLLFGRGIAEVLHNLSYSVQGSDIAENANVRRLKGLGLPVVVSDRNDPLLYPPGWAFVLLRRLLYPRAAAVV